MKRRPNCMCAVCDNAMYRRPTQISGGNVYCSVTCNGRGQQKPKTCPVCKINYIGNKKTCSRACANKARTGISYTKQNTFNKAYKGTILKETVAKKRGGICERCTESNYAILQVHHKKKRHKGGTDALRNLELLCPNCHVAHHYGRALYGEK